MAFIYLLKSVNYPKTYVGSTDRTPTERLNEHNKGYSTFSNKYKPWKLIYYEEHGSLREARLREKYLKSAAGRKFIKKNNIVRE